MGQSFPLRFGQRCTIMNIFIHMHTYTHTYLCRIKLFVVTEILVVSIVLKSDGMVEQVNKMDQVITIEGAKVTTPDVKCSNGYIHVIDTVLVPK